MSINPELRERAARRAKKFIEQETDFHLGFLPTEQSHPLTRNLSRDAQTSTPDAVRSILSADAELSSVARRAVASPEFDRLVSVVVTTMKTTGRICFSGCGSTGRLAVILEAMWRKAITDPGLQDKALSIMTGGERALIRSVENFEDFTEFGARQVRDAQLGTGDVLIAISEGGETSSVIGTATEALKRGCAVFFVFNNPAHLLRTCIRRSRELIDHPDVTTIDLFSGPMALSGSTRMQATTIALLVIGTAIERAHEIHFGNEPESIPGSKFINIDRYTEIVNALLQVENVRSIALLSEHEANCYRQNGLVTYFASDYLLDIFSDTTERSPTFMLPPFRPSYDNKSPAAWSFAKDPFRSALSAWKAMLGREPRGLDWNAADYSEMNAPEHMVTSPPVLDRTEIYSYLIGNEEDMERIKTSQSLAVWTSIGGDAADLRNSAQVSDSYRGKFGKHIYLTIGNRADKAHGLTNDNEHIYIGLQIPSSRVELFSHIAVKLIFNCFSTVTMARIGRISGNWMIQVSPTNKKLIDRATRIISHITGMSYSEACTELFLEIEENAAKEETAETPETESPVARVLRRHETTYKEGCEKP